MLLSFASVGVVEMQIFEISVVHICKHFFKCLHKYKYMFTYKFGLRYLENGMRT